MEGNGGEGSDWEEYSDEGNDGRRIKWRGIRGGGDGRRLMGGK